MIIYIFLVRQGSHRKNGERSFSRKKFKMAALAAAAAAADDDDADLDMLCLYYVENYPGLFLYESEGILKESLKFTQHFIPYVISQTYVIYKL